MWCSRYFNALDGKNDLKMKTELLSSSVASIKTPSNPSVFRDYSENETNSQIVRLTLTISDVQQDEADEVRV